MTVLTPGRRFRDGIVLGIGAGILVVQLILQFQGKDVSEAMILAGVGLIGGVPFLRAGDRGADHADR